MKTTLVAAASAIFCAAVITELSSRLWPGNYLALLILATVMLFLNGLLNLRLAGTSTQPAPARGAQRERAPRAETEARGKSGDRGKPGGRARVEARPKTREAATTGAGPREEGTVKWFNRSKGFGFIIRESGEEIFVHQRSIRGDGDASRRSLRDGQRVSFEVSNREKGLQADDVTPVGND